MIDIYPLFSGSGGNSVLICSGTTEILIDCGVSGSRVQRAIESVGKNPASLQGLFVTHEHGDHIAGVGVMARRFGLNVYATYPTWGFLGAGKISEAQKRIIDVGKPNTVGDLQIECFHTSHDAACPVGYRITDGVTAVAIATDTGIVTKEMECAITGCDKVILESNHDLNMLETGSYPRYLKNRILSSFGHLSNVAAADLAVRLVNSGTKKLMLGHLSAENNRPALAYNTVAAALHGNNINVGKDVVLRCVSPSII